MDDRERREKLKIFLRDRREALRPETVGLEAGSRRRTPGLRREEVAAIARVGVTWYTWLEQGRTIQASRDALQRISRALRLTPTDESYFFLLAGETPPPPPPTRAFEIDPIVRSIIDQCGVLALIWSPHLDVLAYNQLADVIFSFDRYDGPFAENQVWRMFMDPRRRALYLDWEDIAVRAVSELRTLAAKRVSDLGLQALVAALLAESQDFARFWKVTHTEPSRGRFLLRLRHPRLGKLTFARMVLTMPTEADLILLLLAGGDERTVSVLDRLRTKKIPTTSG